MEGVCQALSDKELLAKFIPGIYWGTILDFSAFFCRELCSFLLHIPLWKSQAQEQVVDAVSPSTT